MVSLYSSPDLRHRLFQIPDERSDGFQRDLARILSPPLGSLLLNTIEQLESFWCTQPLSKTKIIERSGLQSFEGCADSFTMCGRTDEGDSPIGIEVILDGKSLVLPDHIKGSLRAIRIYLESMALQHSRLVSFFTVDGIVINIIDEPFAMGGMHRIKADTIGFDELTQQLISTACDRLKHLHVTAENAITQVLINDWPEVQKLWNRWQPDFKSPILVVNFLRELCGARLDELSSCNQTLGQHLTFFQPLIVEVEAVVAARNILGLSNLLETRYAPWLQQLSVFLRQLEQN